MELDTLYLTQICRTCKCVALQMRSLFESYESAQQSPRINEMLMACASVEVLYGDGLPTQMCQICVEQLRTAFIFKRQAERIDANLREYAKNIKGNYIKQEPHNSDFMESLDTLNNLRIEQVKEIQKLSDSLMIPKVETEENNQELFDSPMIPKIRTDADNIKEVVDLGLNNEESNLSDSSMPADNNHDQDSSMEKVMDCPENEIDDTKDVKVENCLETNDSFLEDEDKTITIEHDDAGESSGNTTDSEFLPKKGALPKIKRGRGRPRKYHLKPLKIKATGRGRGRPKIKKEKEEESEEFSCPACQELFNTISTLNKHIKIKHEGKNFYKCNACTKKFSRVDHLNKHIVSHPTVKRYSCEVCTKSFIRRDSLIQHQKLHERNSELECDICQDVFSQGHLLVNHRASKHGIGEKVKIEKKYKCRLCYKSFATEKYLDIHLNGHNGEEQFQCRVCKKTLLTKSHLTEHMKFHNEQAKKFLCSECGQRFIRRDYLVIHMRRHRGEKPFKCKYCGKGFPRTTDLTQHEKYHTGEKTHFCMICGRGFGRSYNLTVHMRTHTGEKPYKCTYCDAAFAQSTDLKVHIQRHTDKKFHCELCNKSFFKTHLLTRHKQTVHGLNIVSNIRRLQPVLKQDNPDENPPIISPLPKPVALDIMFNTMHAIT